MNIDLRLLVLGGFLVYLIVICLAVLYILYIFLYKKKTNRKLTVEEIHKEVEMEDKCGVNSLLQEMFSSEFAESGIDVIINKEGYCEVVKGTTLKIEKGAK
jgi:uncharacterized membrane protein YvbJ